LDEIQADEAGGEVVEGEMDIGAAFVADGEAAVATEPSQRALNGLITNDKFCLTRAERLRLSWPRARVGPTGVGAPTSR
jgi:hypothetical protein